MIGSEEPLVLDMHMARNNPQWKEFFDDQEVMVVFSGPHAYVSPTWYEAEQVVPTWNFTAVHAYGRVEVAEDGLDAGHRLSWIGLQAQA